MDSMTSKVPSFFCLGWSMMQLHLQLTSSLAREAKYLDMKVVVR
jgi:hypothetical protein